MYDYSQQIKHLPRSNSDEHLSLCVSFVLIALYVANLIYTLITHRDVFRIETAKEAPSWSLSISIFVLAAVTVLSAFEASLISTELESSSYAMGLSPFFLGITVLSLIGNAAEFQSAIYFALQKQMSLAIIITLGSTIQVAILLAPLLVLLSFLMGRPMNLVFSTPLELFAIVAVAFSVSSISQDGEVTWFEGAVLLAVYAILMLAFFFVSP